MKNTTALLFVLVGFAIISYESPHIAVGLMSIIWGLNKAAGNVDRK